MQMHLNLKTKHFYNYFNKNTLKIRCFPNALACQTDQVCFLTVSYHRDKIHTFLCKLTHVLFVSDGKAYTLSSTVILGPPL